MPLFLIRKFRHLQQQYTEGNIDPTPIAVAIRITPRRVWRFAARALDVAINVGEGVMAAGRGIIALGFRIGLIGFGIWAVSSFIRYLASPIGKVIVLDAARGMPDQVTEVTPEMAPTA